METEVIPTQTNSFSAKNIFSENLDSLFKLIRFFLTENQTFELLGELSQKLEYEFIRTGFKKYSYLLCFQIAYNSLKEQLKNYFSYNLDFDQVFCLFLRDGLHFKIEEIAAILSLSEGSVLTRLEKARNRAFGSVQSRIFSSTHQCVLFREDLETKKEAPIPNCELCKQFLDLKKASLEFFKEKIDQKVPNTLQNYLTTPFFQKQGKRVTLNWAASPWYLKILFEGFLATTLVLGIVLSIPRIKSLYEFWQEKRLDIYSMVEVATTFGNGDEAQNTVSAPQASIPAASSEETSEVPEIKSETEFVGRGSEKATSDKIYRILIKTDSPDTVKEQALKILTSLNFIPADEEAKTGLELPGGVLFDVFIPTHSFEAAKRELGKLGETKVIITRAKEKGMQGKARLKIWLQRT